MSINERKSYNYFTTLPSITASTPSTHIPTVSPEDLHPFPKANERKKGARKGRKPGETKILTDKPEKK